MTGNIKLNFYSRVLLLVGVLCVEEITGVEWKKASVHAYYKLASLPNSMSLDETLVSEQSNATTIIACSLFCAKNQRVSFYYNQDEMICYCNNDFDTRMTPDEATYDSSSETLYGYIVTTIQVSTNTTTLKYDVQPYRESCFTLYHQGYRTNAIYTVQPTEGYRTNAIYTVQPTEGCIHDTFCDMDSVLDVGADDCLQWLQAGYKDDGVYNIHLSNGTTVRAWCNQTGGGWTVIQRRHNGSLDFYRPMVEYINGFGDAATEYWLGLEAIYLLSQQTSSLRIDMEAPDRDDPQTAYASYDDFSLASAADRYRLSIGTFTGDCGDSLYHNNQRQFSTFDSDNDKSLANCAENLKGAWWFKDCGHSHLNVAHNTEETFSWRTCWGWYYAVKTSSMGIKRS